MTSFDNLPEKEKKRILQDENTLRVMGAIYCRAHHTGEKDEYDLCPECRECIDYSIERTRACPNLHRGNCDQCATRCYGPEMRQRIRAIMAYAGPRMALRHPIMAIRHARKKFMG